MERAKGYRKKYRLRTAVPGCKSIEVTFPYEVVEKEARNRGLSILAFLTSFQAVAEYDNFEGVIYTFEKIASENDSRLIGAESGQAQQK